MRRLLHILLLLCLPLYGFAMQGGLPQAPGAASPLQPAMLLHELEHEQGVAHHHHEEDGSVHYDDSDESREHAQEHSSSTQPAGFGHARLAIPFARPVDTPGFYVARRVPEPFLDGPHRPPSFAPGHAAGGMRHM